ncbi:MAG TPA: glycosyl hydrolase, partial [Vicinamibacteria bacterium]|nr:glycosyl hydrolase [Vicinamibacteria bacterium]
MRRSAWVLALAVAVPVAVAGAAEKAKRAAAPPAAAAGLKVEKARLHGLKARSIGPAVMGGRVSEVAYDPQDPFTFYVALGTGGLFKTTNDGSTFKSIFEKEAVASVGAVAVAPSDAKVVWVGTGEANDRNSSSWGNGVYRSTDGGDTWTHVGLADTRFIARLVVHPTDPATAWVAAAGDLWNAGRDRGLYKTTDAGQTWTKVLAAPAPYDDRVGAGEVVLDPKDPNVLYAALYARQRKPWSFTYGPALTDGKDLGGIFKSTDGGATWRKLDQGLPAQTGRIGLSVFRKDPRIVYAIVQSDAGGQSSIDQVRSRAGGVFRSQDGGASWTRTSSLNPRPFYFSQVRVDPENDQRVWVLGYALHVSHDGGRSFHEDRFGKVHPDCHALAIDPRNPRRIVLGTDGGVYLSRDEGKTWEHLNRFAAGEFYRINVDQGTPYRICGGLQDNVNWVGPSETYSKEGILNSDWVNIGGGDGFYCVFDPDDPNIVYSESQSGYVFRFDLASGQVKELRPEPSEGQTAFRFHWNTPLIGSRHEKGALFLAGNRVFKLEKRGEHFQVVSPDLSAQDPSRTTAVGSGAETYGVVYALAESPARAGLLWAGTDDGKLWVTENGGAHWTDLSAGLPAPARGEWIMRIEPSKHDARVAYLAVDAHRSGNYAPLLYRTPDLGRTWASVA